MKRFQPRLGFAASLLFALTVCLSLGLFNWLNARVFDGKSKSEFNILSLQEYEKKGGHTISRHIAKNEEYLRKRLLDNPTMKTASTFSSYAIADKIIREILNIQQKKIRDWLYNQQDRRERLALYWDAGKNSMLNLGFALERQGQKIIRKAVYSAVVVLKRYKNQEFIVLTAYPR